MLQRRFAQTFGLLACLALIEVGAVYADVNAEPSGSGSIKLQGHAEVLQIQRDMQAWQSSQMYRQGAYLMYVKDYASAAECFKQAGDGFRDSIGEGKFCGEARFAEAQCRRLMGQKAKAAELFQLALEIFRKNDPSNPFLKAAQAYADQLGGGSPKLKGHTVKLVSAVPSPVFRPREGFVDPNIVLKGRATTLAASVQEDEIFSGSKLYAEQPQQAELSDKYVHDALYRAFLEMTCLEMAALGGNYYTAPDMYKAFKVNGKSLVVGAADSSACPEVTLKLNSREYSIPMNLPGIGKRKNVLMATDGLHVLAIDPETNQTWRLVVAFSDKGADFSWWKLTHKKDPRSSTPPVPIHKGKPVKSLFAR